VRTDFSPRWPLITICPLVTLRAPDAEESDCAHRMGAKVEQACVAIQRAPPTNAVGDATDTARDGIAPEHIAPEHKEAAPSGRLIVREPREGLKISSLNVRPI
jgi:hypothetical protein